MVDVRRALALHDQQQDIKAAREYGRKVRKIIVSTENGSGVLVLSAPSVIDPLHWRMLLDDGSWKQLDSRLNSKIQELVDWHALQPKQDSDFGIEDARVALAHAALDRR